ncbi:hypothetical protein CsSME_00029617 [Camellia sinensis var. sinensis]
MDRGRLDLRFHHSGSTPSEESALDLEKAYSNHTNLPSSSPPSLQAFTSSNQHSESNAAYFSWPTSSRLTDAAEDRENYFGNLQKGVLPETQGRLPTGQQATTLLELMTIRAFHSKILRRFSLGTAIGFRIRRGVLTDIPAILVFVARKVHRQWLNHIQCLPTALEGPGGVWCDVDVVEFSYFGAPAATPKEQLYNELVDGLRGSDPYIGSGSQVASQETYGTLGAIVKSRTGNQQVGFLTNRHVAVDLDYPNQKMFHPQPPSIGPGVYLGAVERATSFITDDLWYGIFAGTNPGQNGEKPRPVGIIWGGTANRGRLKLKVGEPPENWTSGVDLGRLLDLLELDLVTTCEGLQAALQEQRNASAVGMDSTVGESSPPDRLQLKDKIGENYEPLGLHIWQVPIEGESHRGPTPSFMNGNFPNEAGTEAAPNLEHQFIPSFTERSAAHENNQQGNTESKNLAALRSGSDEEISVLLQLGEPEPKRRKQSDSDSPLGVEDQKPKMK